LIVSEKFVESVELKIPSCCTAGEPGLRLAETGSACANEMDTACAVALDEAGAFEDAKMAGDGGQRDTERFGEGSHAAFAILRETSEDAAAGGVGEGREDCRDESLIVNHDVKYNQTTEESARNI
jgi:hypothetical protein